MQLRQAAIVVAVASGLYFPASQLLQSLMSSCPSASLYLPASHGVQAVAASSPATSLYLPLSHAVHAAPAVPELELTPSPLVDDQRPFGHSVHAVDSELSPVEKPYVPAPHAVQPYTVAAV